ncbi:hypothetical protein LR48_Vigan03g119100 [Vigna angularis]|uniref:Uncharacterized protein n=1 Tax=Phaseolus angularis TaxID=3914 RepID=A0A0L9U5V8_PHAAN|nr:hypothetical protein LR48_Vigan03g119100 [Vigna angularis]
MGDRGTKKQKASSSVGGRRRRRSPTSSPSSSPPTPTNYLFSRMGSKGNAPHPPLQEGQHEQGQDDEQGSSSTTLNNVINRIEQLQTFVGTRFDAFETRFDALETRFQNIDVVINTRFDALQSRVGNIEQLQHFQSASDNNPQT